MAFRFLFPVVCLCCIAASPAFAWNAAGHRLIAALAWREMTPAARAEASRLLRRHPDYARWQGRQREREVDYGVFLEASTWADEIRDDPRFHDDDAPPTVRLPGFPDMRRHARWHFRDTPEENRARKTPKGEIDLRLVLLTRDLERGTQTARVYALPWVLHLVGDIHQPLHAGGRHDGGGNGVTVDNPYAPGRKKWMSLHAYWDGLPGPSWWRGKDLSSPLRTLAALPPPVTGEVASWLQESRALVAAAYPDAPRRGGVVKIAPEFHQRARRLTERRLADAGYRLGRWLNRLLLSSGTSAGN